MEKETETVIEPVNTTLKEEVDDLEEMVVENRKLLAENNELLKKLVRSNAWAFWLRILWIAMLLGIPFLLYYYVVAPYYDRLNSAFMYFGVELPEIPFLDN